MAIPISNVTRRVVYAASGTGPYSFAFEILAASDIAVYKDDTLLTLTTNYTVTINANGTGYVTLTAAPTGATQVAIVGNRNIQRSSDFVTAGDFFANTLNDELDQQTIFAQQNAEGLDRALKAPQTDPTTIDMTLPRAADRANKTLAFDEDGNPDVGIDASDIANAAQNAQDASDAADAAAASQAAAASSASAAATSASSASTSASSASTSASSASTSASSASTSASNASTSATNAASSATSASSSASTATTQATNAATSATNAANSASAAATSATNASNSATAAATSASDAATSAAAAAAALDNFDDRYLGAKSSNPTVDNDGSPLVTGALYYRTTSPVGMKVYDGAQWLEASAAQQASMVTYEYVATAGQTTFSGADANGVTLSYVANSIIVSLNGVVLRPGDDYTASNGTSVVLASAAALSDELVVQAFAVFNVANTYTQGQVDGFLSGKQAADAELTTLAGMSSSRATFLASTEPFAWRNRIINGDMRIDQRNNGASVTPTGITYTVDRWRAVQSQLNKFSVQQSSVAPAGFTKSLLITSLSAYSITTGDYFVVDQPVEGYNVADFNWGSAAAQNATLSFWVRSSLTGTFGGSIQNNANNRSYPFTYTISAANTWEQKSVAITGDTSGTWLTDNSVGLILRMGLGVGATFSASANAWGGASYFSATGATSVVGTSGATFYITGVQLEPGSVASPFERVEYGEMLRRCQRYFEFVSNQTMGMWVNASVIRFFPKFQVRKRANPTLSLSTTTPYAEQIAAAGVTGSGSAITLNGGNVDGVDCEVNGFSGRSYGQFGYINPCVNANSEL